MAVLCISHTYKDSTWNSFTRVAIHLLKKFQPPGTDNFHAHAEDPTTPEHSLRSIVHSPTNALFIILGMV
jgi:hypothetical protein